MTIRARQGDWLQRVRAEMNDAVTETPILSPTNTAQNDIPTAIFPLPMSITDGLVPPAMLLATSLETSAVYAS